MSTRRNWSLETFNGCRPLRTTIVRAHEDIRAFFDAQAEQYAETHGDPSSLLRYRLSLIHERAHFQPTDVVLEIGCGHGLHLLALADSFGRGIGIDLSPAMLRVARRHARGAHGRGSYSLPWIWLRNYPRWQTPQSM